MHRKWISYISLLAIHIIVLTSCASSPTGRSQMILKSDAALEQEGSRQFKRLREPYPRNRRLEGDEEKGTVLNILTLNRGGDWIRLVVKVLVALTG